MTDSKRLQLLAFIRLMEQGKSVESMQQFYAPDVVVFENRELARAGLERCVSYERDMLTKLAEPPTAKALAFAYDDASDASFIEWLIRFTLKETGRPMRVEQVAVQKWERGKITQERFYFEGVVDEGD